MVLVMTKYLKMEQSTLENGLSEPESSNDKFVYPVSFSPDPAMKDSFYNTRESENYLYPLRKTSINEKLPKSNSFHTLEDSALSLQKASSCLEQILHPILDHIEKEQENQCECGEKSGRIGVPFPCYYCSVTKNIPKKRTRRLSFPLYASTGIQNYATSISKIENLNNPKIWVSSEDKPIEPTVIDVEEVAVSHSRGRYKPEDSGENNNKFRSTAEFLCNYRMQKFFSCFTLSIIIIHFAFNIPILSISFFNYTVVLAVFGLYPIFCVLGLLYDKAQPYLWAIFYKYLKRSKSRKRRENAGQSTDTLDDTESNHSNGSDEVVYVSGRKRSRKVSVASNLTSITEEDGLNKLESEDDGDYSLSNSHSEISLNNSVKEHREIIFYSPCKDCIKGNTLGICLHPPT